MSVVAFKWKLDDIKKDKEVTVLKSYLVVKARRVLLHAFI